MRDARIAAQVRWPAAPVGAIEENAVTLKGVPDHGGEGGTVRVHRRERGEAGPFKEGPNRGVVQPLCAHEAYATRNGARRPWWAQ